METTKQGKHIYHSIKEQLIRSQKLKQELLPYLQEHYPVLLQKKSRLERIKECANSVSFRRYIDTGEVRLLNGSFCKYDRICLACAIKRSMKMIKKYSDNIVSQGLKNKQRYFITLTIKHQKRNSLDQLLDKLFAYRDTIARRFRNGKRKSQKSKSFFSQFEGMAIATEITHGEKNGWHPHFHILACSDKTIQIDKNKHWRSDQTNDDLIQERKNITKDSFSVNIRKIDVINKPFSRNGIGEVFKYAIKFSSLGVEHLAKVMSLQHKNQYRFFSSYGIFRGWKIEDNQKRQGDWSDGVFLWDEEVEKYEIIK